jgi:hypothetical protein
MSTRLRPMTLGEILDRTLQIYRSRFRFFLAIGALPALATLATLAAGLLLDGILSQTTLARSTKTGIEYVGASISVEAWQSLFRFAAWPMLIYAASQKLFEQKPPFRATLAQCMSRWQSWIAVSLLLWSVWDGVPALMYRLPILERARLNALLTLKSGLSSIGLWPRSFFFLWAGFLVALAISVTLWCCVPVWVLEELPLRAVLKRGRAFVKRARSRITFAWFVFTALGWILSGSVSFFLMFLFRIFFYSHPLDGSIAVFRAAMTIPVFAVSALVGPLFPIALTLIYYDQRIRHEGFDIEWMMNAAGMNAPLPSAAPVVPVAGVESGEQPA